MRRTFLLLCVALFFLASCKNTESKKEQSNSKSQEQTHRNSSVSSSGTINSLSIVIDDSLWKGEIGEALRNKLTSPVKGLPQQEPLFSLSHIPPKAFSGFTRTSRLFLKIEAHDTPYFKILHNRYANPQTGIIIGGKNSSAIKKVIDDKADTIIKTLKNTEVKANQKRISKSLKDTKILEKHFGLTMKIPSVYRYAKEKKDFVWMRKDIRHGSMELMIYQVPLNVIDQDTNTVGNIIKMRDSIGEKYIPGPNEGTHMITEQAYAPFLFKRKIDGKFTYLTKGTWEVKGAYMAGPFVNFAIRDEENSRYLILEGFVFKPQAPTKRNNIFELESIIKSAKIK